MSMFYSTAKATKEQTNIHKGLKKRICYICGKKFKTMESGLKFCSQECINKYRKIA